MLGRRPLRLAALASIVGGVGLTAPATFAQSPPATIAPVDPATPINPAAQVNPTAAATSESVIRGAVTDLSRGDVAAAIAGYRRAVHTLGAGANHPAAAALGSRLVAMGVDQTLLDLPPAAFKPLPAIGSASPEVASPSDAAAGEAVAGDDLPTWMTSGIRQAVATTDGDAGVRQMGGGGSKTTGNVVPVQYDTNTDAKADLGTVSAEEAVGRADGYFDAGMTLLSEGDQAGARREFLKAWEYEDQLDADRRQLLRDKLTLLQPRRLAPTTPAAEPSPLERAKLAEQEKTRRLYREVTSELASIEQTKTSAPMDAEEDLQALLTKVDGSDVSEDAKRALNVMVNRAIASQKQYIEANRADIQLELENASIKAEMAREDAMTAEIDEEVSALVEEFNSLMRERRFEEANVIAKQVQLLKPDDPIATSMYHNSRIGTWKALGEEVQGKKADAFLSRLHEVEEAAVAPVGDDQPLLMPEPSRWADISERRRGYGEGDDRMSEAEREIKAKLTMPVEVRYRNRPLGEVLDDLSALTGVPMVIDEPALSSVRVTAETPVTLQVNTSLRLKSALQLILERLELAYVIRNDVMMITSREESRGALVPKTYKVSDLVTPIPDFPTSYEDGLAGALRAAYQMTNPTANVQMMPVSMTDMAMAQSPNAAASNPAVLGQYNAMGSQGGFGMGGPVSGSPAGGGAAFADFNSLIELITTTIEPDTWEQLGGSSTLFPYPQNLSLVISTTSDVHDQINDLLESLRRLQSLQITIEVRFITLADSFAEEIGVDFDLQFDDNLSEADFFSEDNGPSVSFGINADNTLTDDFDIQINQSLSTPAPLGITTSPTTLGFAILSDIEAFFFLSAAQTDNRSNIMQAPKVTLFDGQLASIQDITQRPFVTSITPVVGDFAVAQQPIITVLNEGTQLSVRGTISNDKRFVRLTLVPFFSQIGPIDTFTFEGRQSSRRNSQDQTDTNGDGVVDENDEVDTEDEFDIVEGTTVQLPQFAFTSVSTTVSVPDGGTILLGGIKRLSEARAENGVPILSKIPYVSRLFRNQAAARDARSLMLMVTPRIIIQEEEELAQTGFDPRRN